MIIVLNGPLGIGKSTLAEALSERIEQCVMLDGDHLVAANPPHADELAHLHSTSDGAAPLWHSELASYVAPAGRFMRRSTA